VVKFSDKSINIKFFPSVRKLPIIYCTFPFSHDETSMFSLLEKARPVILFSWPLSIFITFTI